MSKQIRVVVEYTEDDQICNREIITEKKVKEISSISELGFCHKEQIDILQSCQDELLKAQSYSLKEKISSCPRCGVKLKLADFEWFRILLIGDNHILAITHYLSTLFL